MNNIKKLILITILIGGISFSGISSKSIVNYTKSGGLLGLYSRVSSTYMGFSSSLNAHLYNVVCESPGVNRCKRDLSANPLGDASDGSALLAKIGPQIDQMHDEIDETVSNDEVSGSGSKTIVYTFPDNTKTTIVMSWVWDYDLTTDETSVTLTVEDVGDVL